MRVRCPSAAHRTAVAAATVVLPTPPLPVKSRTRTGEATPTGPSLSIRAATASPPPGSVVVAGTRGALDACLELRQRRLDDAALRPALHEAGDGDHQVDSQLVRDLGDGRVVGGGAQGV